jgi:hypothetical protein
MISDVQLKAGYLQIFDANGKKVSELYASGVELLGVGSDFYVIKRGGYFQTYDERSKKIAELYASKDTFVSSSGMTFNIKKNSYILRKQEIVIDEYCLKNTSKILV